MKLRFFFFLLLCSITGMQGVSRQQVINAIIESDYDFLVTHLKGIPVKATDKKEFLQLNDDIITVRQKWVIEHAGKAQIGTDLFLCVGSSLLAAAGSIIFATAALLSDEVTNTTTLQITGGTMGVVGTIYAIKKYIDAFSKPKRLLANAIRIKGLLYALDTYSVLN